MKKLPQPPNLPDSEKIHKAEANKGESKHNQRLGKQNGIIIGDFKKPSSMYDNIEELRDEKPRIPYKTISRSMIHKKDGGNDSKEAESKKAKSSTMLPKVHLKPLTPAAKLTNWVEISPKKLLDFYSKETNAESKSLCPLCAEEYYEGINALPDEKLMELNQKMLSGEKEMNVVILSKCSNHFFHKECVERLMDKQTGFKCPLCDTIYGILTGDMPDGKMSDKVRSFNCAGYPDYSTIEIVYTFPDGEKDGVKYKGTVRKTYLPNNEEGKEVLSLLKIAFERKLTFTIGRSLTTGINCAITWNGIHHKTSLIGGPTMYGYPDPDYLTRVKEELAKKGIYPINKQK